MDVSRNKTYPPREIVDPIRYSRSIVAMSPLRAFSENFPSACCVHCSIQFWSGSRGAVETSHGETAIFVVDRCSSSNSCLTFTASLPLSVIVLPPPPDQCHTGDFDIVRWQKFSATRGCWKGQHSYRNPTI